MAGPPEERHNFAKVFTAANGAATFEDIGLGQGPLTLRAGNVGVIDSSNGPAMEATLGLLISGEWGITLEVGEIQQNTTGIDEDISWVGSLPVQRKPAGYILRALVRNDGGADQVCRMEVSWVEP